jgi:hypothetical protein
MPDLPAGRRQRYFYLVNDDDGRLQSGFRPLIERHFDSPIHWVGGEFTQQDLFDARDVATITGTIRRIRFEGEVSFADGGWIPFEGGGSVWVHRADAAERRASMGLVFIRPGTYEYPMQRDFSSIILGISTNRWHHLVALHPDGVRAVKLRLHERWYERRSGLAVNWVDGGAYFDFQSSRKAWTLEEWRDARLLLFSDSPVGFVQRMVVPGG